MSLTPAALSLALALTASTGEIGVLFPSARAAAPGDDVTWLPARLADLVAQKLELLGATVRDRRFLDIGAGGDPSAAGLEVLLIGRVHPEAAGDPSAPIAIDLELRGAGAKSAKKKLAGTAEELDRLASEAALFSAGAAGLSVSEEAQAFIASREYPFLVQRSLGLARAHYDSDEWRKSMLMYDRAAELLKLGALPEASSGRLAAEAELIGRGESEYGARAELAPSAAERADVALRKGDEQAGLRALESFLRYTPDRAKRWSVELPLAHGSPVIARGARWTVQGGAGRLRRWTIEPKSGAVIAREPGLKGLLDFASGQPLVLDDRTLERLDEKGHPRWKLLLASKPRGGEPHALKNVVELTSGLVAVIGDRSVAWVDVSLGALTQVANEVVPLASGSAGVLVLLSRKGEGATQKIALLRPGKKSAAWTTEVPPPIAAAMTVDRILVLTKEGLRLLRAFDGKESAKPIGLAGEARIIGVDGRYGAVADGGAIAIIDVLGGERTATARGPGDPVGAYTTSSGVAILFGTGDLLFYDRDGAVLDRARVPGEPFGLIRGSPMTPGPVAVTSLGLFAFAEVPSDAGRMRDVDAMLRLAGIFERMGEPQAALRLAQAVAKASAGRVDRAEQLRAELLKKSPDPASQAAARWAEERARLAKDPTKPLPPFRVMK